MADTDTEKFFYVRKQWEQWKQKNPNTKNNPNLGEVFLREDILDEAYYGEADLSGFDLRGLDLQEANLSRFDLSGADLLGAHLSQANLSAANLSGACLIGIDACKLNLSGANLSGAYLSGANLSGANLSRAILVGANLSKVILSRADLSDADLCGVDLSGVDLSGANLNRTKVLRTKFERTVLTEACLQDWNINSATDFTGAICDYAYLKVDQQERRPREGTFQLGEFAALFQQAVDTVDLIFKDGIDWQAFFQSFQDLQSQYAEQDLSIQAIEKKRGGAFVVRLEVPDNIDKAAVEEKAKALYGEQLKQIEGHYQQLLQLQGQQLDDYREQVQERKQENSKLLGIVETLAEKESASKYDLRGAQIAGGVADKVQGDQVGGTINNAAPETPSLAEATAKIQELLKQLEASNPNATEADQTAYLNIMIPPTRRERFISAIQPVTATTALEDIPYAPLLKALVKSWQSPGSGE